MAGNVFVDTNILVYCRDASELEKQRRAAAWMAHLWTTKCGRLSYQVLRPGLDRETTRREIRSPWKVKDWIEVTSERWTYTSNIYHCCAGLPPLRHFRETSRLLNDR